VQGHGGYRHGYRRAGRVAEPTLDHLACRLREQTEVAHQAAGEPVISVDAKKKLRHEVARSERTRRMEDRPDAGCIVSGLCSSAWSHPRRASVPNRGAACAAE